MKYEKIVKEFKIRCQKEIKRMPESNKTGIARLNDNAKKMKKFVEVSSVKILNDILHEEGLDLDKTQQEELLKDIRPIARQLVANIFKE